MKICDKARLWPCTFIRALPSLFVKNFRKKMPQPRENKILKFNSLYFNAMSMCPIVSMIPLTMRYLISKIYLLDFGFIIARHQ